MKWSERSFEGYYVLVQQLSITRTLNEKGTDHDS
jgi:hypothetical protein